MKDLLLNDGNKIPLVGFGTYKLLGQEAVQAVSDALNNDYRLIDTATVYKNEEAVGLGIKKSGVDRKEISVTTKLWRENLGYNQAKTAFQESLYKLGLEYIDMYLIHWPANAKNYTNWQKANADAWRAMEELKGDGLIKSIAVSNFWEEHLEVLLQTANIMPAINQIEFHPGYWQPQLTEYCKEKNIVLESWSPMARGKVFGNKVLEEIAKKYQMSVSQVCLRWIIQKGVMVIPKSTNLSRIKENIDLFDFELFEDDMLIIDQLPEMGFSGELPNEWPDRVHSSQ